MVVTILMVISVNAYITQEWLETPLLETLWTISPTLVLIFLCLPSIYVLYSTTVEVKCLLRVKVIGHQWYWTFDYSDLVIGGLIDRYTTPSQLINFGEFLLIDVDNRCVLPIEVDIILVVTSMDVIHSFSLPSIGIKVDCNPGYLNIIKVIFPIPGLHYGFCREICGSGHRQISICVEVTSISLFKEWIKRIGGELNLGNGESNLRKESVKE